MFVLFKKFPFFRRLKVKISGENNRISPFFSEMGGGATRKNKNQNLRERERNFDWGKLFGEI